MKYRPFLCCFQMMFYYVLETLNTKRTMWGKGRKFRFICDNENKWLRGEWFKIHTDLDVCRNQSRSEREQEEAREGEGEMAICLAVWVWQLVMVATTNIPDRGLSLTLSYSLLVHDMHSLALSPLLCFHARVCSIRLRAVFWLPSINLHTPT